MAKNIMGMVQRTLVVLVSPAMLLAGCGGDDSGASTTSDQEVADHAIAAVEQSLRADGFAPASDRDEGGDLVFESDECRDFDRAFPGGEGGIPGKTASAEIEDYERGEPAAGDVQETVRAFAGFVEERQDLDPILQLLNDEGLGRCLEEVFRIGAEKAAAKDQATVAVGAVEIEQLGSGDLGDSGGGVQLTGELTAAGASVPFSLAFQGIQVDRALVGIITTGVGPGEPIRPSRPARDPRRRCEQPDHHLNGDHPPDPPPMCDHPLPSRWHCAWMSNSASGSRRSHDRRRACRSGDATGQVDDQTMGDLGPWAASGVQTSTPG